MAAAEIGAAGGQAIAVETDITWRADCTAVVATVMERFGALDIMGVNDAAGIHARATEMTEDVWRRVMEVDLTGCFNCAQVASIGMIEQGRGGSIVMVSAN